MSPKITELQYHKRIHRKPEVYEKLPETETVQVIETEDGRKIYLDGAKRLHPDFPNGPPTGWPGVPVPPKYRKDGDLKRTQCGWWGGLTKACSLARGGCGYRFPEGRPDIEYCPWCGLDRWCRANVMKGQKKCRSHGGDKKLGQKPGQNKGRFKLTIDRKFNSDPADAYLYAKLDPEMLKLEKHIAVLDSRLEQLFDRLKTPDSLDLWEALSSLARSAQAHRQKVEDVYQAFIQALAQKDQEMMKKRLDELGQLVRDHYLDDLIGVIHDGRSDWSNWTDIHRTIEARRKVTVSQTDQLTKMHQMMRVEDVLSQVEKVYMTVEDVLKDSRINTPEKQLAAIGYRLKRQFSDMSPVVHTGSGSYWRSDVLEGRAGPVENELDELGAGDEE